LPSYSYQLWVEQYGNGGSWGGFLYGAPDLSSSTSSVTFNQGPQMTPMCPSTQRWTLSLGDVPGWYGYARVVTHYSVDP
jgi:hypothetical protein